eukprot:CAMPEP_0183336166 /NCGR_PEP_ID=MMETSP0164_2-20130417/4231_1 /TAXON_ID=221442 /ORGANISM="Coccolithus pelagicus ssp braarudi, Strain PLY182g" /LENGTH=350 /DNA_ID=CAMNT_0025505639 /DNA_START=11 /DNA_END=1062 /DNA_ORIENTATION=-
MASAAEVEYTLRGVTQDMRDDGRGRLDFRSISIDVGLFPQCAGSARVQLGSNDVLVGVVAELDEPDAATPSAGRVTVTVSLGPSEISLSSFGGADGGGTQWLEEALAPLYSHSSIPSALDALCIVKHVQCWHLRVHAQLLQCDGCPLDAISLGVKAALQHTRIPKTSVGPAAGGVAGGAAGTAGGAAQLDLDLDENLDESIPFEAAGLPAYVTLATVGSHLVADISAKEMPAVGASLSLAINVAGDVCGIRMAGDFGVNVLLLADMLQTARQLVTELLAAATSAIDAAAAAALARGFPHADGATTWPPQGLRPIAARGNMAAATSRATTPSDAATSCTRGMGEDEGEGKA